MAHMPNALQHALRRLAREPAFIAGVSVTFALAVSATSAMFTLVDHLMFAPPPGIAHAERVVRARFTFANDDGNATSMESTSFPVFETVAAATDLVAKTAIVRTDTVTLGTGEELTRVTAIEATEDYFSALGARPALGRLFAPSSDTSPAGSDVVVLSHAFWQGHFGGDRAVIGQSLVVGGATLTIIGVTTPGFNGTGLSPVDLFLPLATAMRGTGTEWRTNSGMLLGVIIARLRDGIVPDVAAQSLSHLLQRAQTSGPNAHALRMTLEPLVAGTTSRSSLQGRVALWLTGVAILVLVIATANAATLVLLRSARRRREVGIELALGSSTGRLLRDSMLEGAILAFVGALCGSILSLWLADLIRVTLLPSIAPLPLRLFARGAMLAVVSALLAGLLAGVAPIALFRGRALATQLRVGGEPGASGRFVTQRVLVALQVMMSTVLLVGAALFTRSMQRVQSQDLGFSRAHLLLVSLDFPGGLVGAARNAAFGDALMHLRNAPGVVRASVVQSLPFGSHNVPPIGIPGHPLPPPNEQQLPIMYGATPDLLAMLDLRARDGRLLTERDTRGTPLVVLVSETMARSIWPGERAVGKCIRIGFPTDFDLTADDPMLSVTRTPCREVVGVVKDVRARSLRTEGGEARLPQYYVPFDQLPDGPMHEPPGVNALLVETQGAPELLAPMLQRLIQRNSAVAVIARARPYQELIDPQLRSWRLGATLFLSFGALALVIAALGLFAVVSYVVNQRTREIGVRLALGGGRSRIVRLVIGDAVRMTLFGAGAGVLIALISAPLIQPFLFATSARDPVSLTWAVTTLLVVTLVASVLPAHRASHVSPMLSLRAEG